MRSASAGGTDQRLLFAYENRRRTRRTDTLSDLGGLPSRGDRLLLVLGVRLENQFSHAVLHSRVARSRAE